jgi:protein TonB
MAEAETFHEPHGNRIVFWGGMIALTVIVGGLLYLAFQMLTSVNGVKIEAAPATAIDMLPLPPPPPPPPPERPPEPQDAPKDAAPEPQPQPDKPAPAPMQIDGPAQAGSDAYGMTAGSGGGMGSPGTAGTCVGPRCGTVPVAGTDRFWGRNAANALESHIQGSGKVNVDAFVSQYDIWVDGSGNVTRAQLIQTSGNSKLDQTVLALLRSAGGLKPPPASIRMPQRIKVGRKRG